MNNVISTTIVEVLPKIEKEELIRREQSRSSFPCYDETVLLCPPSKRGHIILQLSVGRSVDQVLSAQYLLAPVT